VQAEFIKVPSAYQHRLFFSSNQIKFTQIEGFEEAMETIPFIYELTSLELGIEGIKKPWEDKGHTVIPKLLKLWEEKQKVLNLLFEERKRKETKEPMMWSIVIFLNFLFWSNGQNVSGLTNLQESVHSIPFKPINVVERLGFIIENPGQYHSFIQLSELFTEYKKQYYKQKLLSVSKK